MKNKWRSIFFIVCLSWVGLPLFASPASAQTPIKLNYSVFFPAPHIHSVLAVEWGKELEKRTNGRVKVDVLPGGTLTPADKCYDGVEKGISDLGMSVFAYTRGKFPLTEVIDLPLGIKNGLAATRLINDYYNKFKPKELDGVKVMFLHAHGPGLLHTKNTPVNKLEDLKGMKVRCTGLATKIVSSLGGTPVAMPMGETYDALSRGVVDASMAPQESLNSWKWGEVVKYTTEDIGASYSTGMFVVMNKDKWKSLPPDIQKTIENFDSVAVVPFQQVAPEESVSGAMRCPLCGLIVNATRSSGSPETIVERIFLEQLDKKNPKSDIIAGEQVAGVFRRISTDSLTVPHRQVLLDVAKELGAEGVVAGYVYRYRERIGRSYSVEQPASVAFEIHLLRVSDGVLVWRGTFEKEQSSLMEDMLQFASFFRGKGKWLTAEQLTGEGMEQLLKTFPGLP